MEVESRANYFDPSCTNIILGCHLLDPEMIPSVPANSIIVNTEQLGFVKEPWNSRVFEWGKHFETWDYSPQNIHKLKKAGLENVKEFKIGFQKELRRIPANSTKDIDVLFYGSGNDRRMQILNQLGKKGLKVEAFAGIYGEERDEYIARSKVVLNLHYYESKIFEVPRVFYLMTNSVCVVGEVGEDTQIHQMYLDGIYPAKYEDLADACATLVHDDARRKEYEERAFAAISACPQKLFTAELI